MNKIFECDSGDVLGVHDEFIIKRYTKYNEQCIVIYDYNGNLIKRSYGKYDPFIWTWFFKNNNETIAREKWEDVLLGGQI